MSENKPLGELNGKYAFLFKVNMVLLPIMFSALLTWGVWVTSSIFSLKGFVEHGPRFTLKDAMAMKESIIEHVEDHFEHKN